MLDLRPIFYIIFILLGLVLLLAGYFLVDWIFIDDAIRVYNPIIPELELTVKDNIVDTIYIYRKP